MSKLEEQKALPRRRLFCSMVEDIDPRTGEVIAIYATDIYGKRLKEKPKRKAKKAKRKP